jgi:glycosyltransferase involved in cell wall biosynthesis
LSRTLILCTASEIGGMQRVVVDLARVLRGTGSAVRCVVPKSPQSGRLLEWAARQGVAMESQGALLDAAAPHTWRGVWRLRQFISAASPEVVNVHYGDNFMSLKDLLAIRLAQPGRIVATVHHPTDWSESGRLKKRMTVLAARLADAIVVPSRATANVLGAAGIAPSRICVVPNGVPVPERPPTRVDARGRLGLPPEAFVVGTLARLAPHKGIDDLVRAMVKVDDPRVVLAVAGDGEERAMLETLAAPLGDRVRFLGRVEDAADLYASSDVFALPSLLEGFGLVFVEAAMFGVPSIAADAGAVAEVVENGLTGVLVPPGDPSAVAAAVTALRDDPATRDRMGRAARARAMERFTDRAMAAGYARVFAGNGKVPEALQELSGQRP